MSDPATPPAKTEPSSELGRMNRRRWLAWTGATGAGAVALVGAGYLGYRIPGTETESATPEEGTDPAAALAPGALQLHSLPDLQPPRVVVGGPDARTDGDGPAYFFIGPNEVPQAEQPAPQTGLMIVDRTGELVWFRHLQQAANDFRVQRYQGRPVLTWWQGKAGIGYGQGRCVIADAGYRPIAEVQAVGDDRSDLHEFLITDRDTALLTIYRTVSTDLSEAGGPADGKLITGLVQEVDIATGELLFEWDSLDHVALSESDVPLPDEADQPWDYFHVNSVAELGDDQVLISARNTHAIYAVSKSTGEVAWTLGGNNSDFEQDRETSFHFQHNAQPAGKDRVLIFDNAAGPPPKAEMSRAIVVELDRSAQAARLVRAWAHPTELLSDFMGSAQRLDDNRMVVGWGSQPYFTEFTDAGEVLLDGKLPDSMMSYRISCHDWVGDPADPPTIGFGVQKVRGVTVYASWNGSTETAGWQVYAGEQPGDLSPVGAVAERTGFETAIGANTEGPFFAVAALDVDGEERARSEVIKA